MRQMYMIQKFLLFSTDAISVKNKVFDYSSFRRKFDIIIDGVNKGFYIKEERRHQL